jgi:fucose permease
MATAFLIVIYAAFISLGLPDSLLGVGWPLMHLEYNVPESFAGIVSMIISGGTIVSSLVSGRILKRFGVGRVTVVSVLMTAGALLGFSYAPSFIWLTVMALPLGLGAGSVDSGLNDYVAKHYKAHHMSWLHSFWGVGAMSSPLVMSYFITNNQTWRNGYLTVALIQFGLVALLFLTLPLWDKVAKNSPLREAVEAEATTNQSPNTSANKGLFAPLSLPGIKRVLLVFMLYCGVESTMGLWGSSFLVNTKGLDAGIAAQWVSLYYGCIMFGRFISGFLTLRFNNTQMIRGGEIVVLVGVLCLLLPLPDVFVMVGFALVGLGCAPIFPSTIHETPVRFGVEEAQNAMGFQMATAYVGATLLPPIFGFIATNTTFNLLPYFLLAYILVMLVNSELFNRDFAQRRQQANRSSH